MIKPAKDMTDAEITAELKQLEAEWDAMCRKDVEDVARGGSPFEWMDERMAELTYWQKERAK